MTAPGAQVIAYANWEDDYVSMCRYCDTDVKRDFDGNMIWVDVYGDHSKRCPVRFEEEGEHESDPDDYPHEGWDYDSDSFQMDLEAVADYMKELWPSLYDADKWPHNEVHVFLENSLAEFSVSEYCGMVSLCIAVSDAAIDSGQEGLAKAWIARIEGKFLEKFSTLHKLGTFSNGESVYKRKGDRS